MKYYKLIHSDTPKSVGIFPQIISYYTKYNKLTLDDKINLRIDVFKKFDKELPYFKLDKKAKLTDILSVVLFIAHISLVNEKLLKILKEFNLFKFQAIPITVIDKNELLHSYTAINPMEYHDEYLAIEDCEFNSFGEELTFKSYSDFASYPSILWPVKLIFREIPKEDFFVFKNVSIVKPIISQRLKDKLEKENISGCYFEEISIGIKHKVQ